MNDLIWIEDLEVFYHVGVPDSERARAQRLLLSIELDHDFTRAARSDEVHDTIDYHAVVRRLLGFGQARSWRLLETLAHDIAVLLLDEFPTTAVRVTIKKFILPETRHVAVRIERKRNQPLSPP